VSPGGERQAPVKPRADVAHRVEHAPMGPEGRGSPACGAPREGPTMSTACSGLWVIDLVVKFVIDAVGAIRDIVVGLLTGLAEGVRKLAQALESTCSSWGPFSFICHIIVNILKGIAAIIDGFVVPIVNGVFTVLDRILDTIRVAVGFVLIGISWIYRGFDLLACMNGGKELRHLRLTVRVLADQKGTPLVPLAEVEQWVLSAKDVLLAECNVMLHYDMGMLGVSKKVLSSTFDCGWPWIYAANMDLLWEKASPCGLTLYVVEGFANAAGCHLHPTEFIMVDRNGGSGANQKGLSILHEFCHASGVLPHTGDPKNLMFGAGAGPQISDYQCCMMRTSRFVSTL
jgi:hypothetical protein